jgi:predicted amidophosphoribosyltransferase
MTRNGHRGGAAGRGAGAAGAAGRGAAAARVAAGAALDLLLPPRCLGCGAPGAALCEFCVEGLRLLDRHLCALCGAPRPRPGDERCRECRTRRLAFASARAAIAYDGTVRGFVGAWKERGVRGAAPLAAGLVLGVVPRPAVDVISWVPPDADRALRRGHHPAERLARELALRWGLPAAPLLARRAGSRRQRGLARSERQANVQGAFRAAARRGPPPPPRIAIVDDVYTTGATVSAAAAALLEAGAERVEVVTLARAVR